MTPDVTTLPPLRDAQKEVTRDRILDAAIELLNVGDLDVLTNGEIAERAGIAERTVYRHFPTREDLLRDLWAHLQKRMGAGPAIAGAADLAALSLRLFARFDTMPGAVTASAFSKTGLEMRMAVNDERKASYLAAVREARPELDDAAQTRLAAVAMLISSAWGWSVMRNFWGLDAQQSGLAAAEAISSLLGVGLPPGAASPDVKPSPKPG